MAGIDFQLSLTEYDAAGNAYRTIDNLGRINETDYDAAGRTVKTIQNYDANGLDRKRPARRDRHRLRRYGDVPVRFRRPAGHHDRLRRQRQQRRHAGDDEVPVHVADQRLVADRRRLSRRHTPATFRRSPGNLTRTGGIATAMVANHGYGTISGSALAGRTRRATTVGCKSSTATPTTFTFAVPSDTPTTATGNIQVRAFAADQDVTTTDYDRLGRDHSTTDQRGVTHKYTYDSAGRLSEDAATTPGGWRRTWIMRSQAIGTTYDDLGRVQAVTSYADTAETTVVNQVFDEYDGWGNLAREWQANGAG